MDSECCHVAASCIFAPTLLELVAQSFPSLPNSAGGLASPLGSLGPWKVVLEGEKRRQGSGLLASLQRVFPRWGGDRLILSEELSEGLLLLY